MQTIVNLVSAGMGLAWVPDSVTRLQRPGVVYRAVADAGLRCETSLVWRADAPPVVARFVAHVLAQIAAHSAAPGGPNAPLAASSAGSPAQQRQSCAGGSRRPDDDSECC